MVGREAKTTNNRTIFPTLKNNAAAGYKGPLKIELLKGAGLLFTTKVACFGDFLVMGVYRIDGWYSFFFVGGGGGGGGPIMLSE